MTRHADYYQRVKQDPEKLAALRARRARNQRERRSRISPCSQQDTELLTTDPVKDALAFFDEPVVSTPVVSNLGGKHAPTVPPGELTLTPEQIMEAWRGVWNQ